MQFFCILPVLRVAASPAKLKAGGDCMTIMSDYPQIYRTKTQAAPNNIKAYVFDLDGTLLDSMDVWSKIDIEFLHKRGFAVPDDYAHMTTAMSFQQAAEYTIQRFNLSESAESLMRQWRDMAVFAYGNTIQMKPYAKEYLSSLKKCGAKLAIATSAAPDHYDAALRAHGIYEWFDVICSTEDVGCGKTSPDIYLLVADKLGVPPCDCLVFEDILPAVKSAKSIGMTVYAVYDKFSDRNWAEITELADGAIYSFEEAPLPCGYTAP